MGKPWFMDELIQNPRQTLIQCSHRSIVDRCPNVAIAYVFTSQHKPIDAVPALCVSCCIVAIERAKPGEQLIFQRIET